MFNAHNNTFSLLNATWRGEGAWLWTLIIITIIKDMNENSMWEAIENSLATRAWKGHHQLLREKWTILQLSWNLSTCIFVLSFQLFAFKYVHIVSTSFITLFHNFYTTQQFKTWRGVLVRCIAQALRSEVWAAHIRCDARPRAHAHICRCIGPRIYLPFTYFHRHLFTLVSQ